MSRLYIIVIAIGLFIAFAFPEKTMPIPASSSSDTRGTFSSTSSHPVSTKSRRQAMRSDQSVTYNDGSAVVLNREANGHFYANAQVNGMPVRFLVDTGASGVALTTADAQKVGLTFARSEFGNVGQGASGGVNGKFVTLTSVSMKGKTVQNVSGVILDGGDTSLLGQSFLSRMGKIEITGDRMVIR